MKSFRLNLQTVLSRSRRCWWKSVTLMLAAVLAVVLLPAAGQKSPDPKTLPAPKRVVVPKLHGTVKLDGDLDEPVWKKAAVLKPFFQNDGSGREREQTEV